ncbi:MAG: DUF4375 domain-containing protein [Pedosphaera sp.]|nr:DUF4375 domain-containing protein [Pedosphaera sp.]
MKTLAISIGVIIVAGFILGLVRWKQARNASAMQALLDQAEKTSAKLADYAEKEYGPLGTTTDEILSHENDDKADRVLIGLLYRIGQKSAARGDESLTYTERKLRAASHLEGQVMNGGFDQYFFNPSGDDSETAFAGLNEMGATGSARLLERAMAAFSDGKPPKDREKRWKAMDSMARRSKPLWDQCDSEFYDLKENIAELSLAYAKRKRLEIVLP